MRTEATPQNVTSGVLLIITTALLISLQDVVFKLFSSRLTLWQIFAMRGIFTLPLLLLIGGMRGRLRSTFRLAYTLWPLARGLCLTLTFLTFYAAIPFISLATAGAAIYIAPILIAVLSVFVIDERVGLLGWLGVFVGFAGVIVLLQPGTEAFSPVALLPLTGAAFYAVGHIITRSRCQTAPPEVLALSLNTMMCLAGLAISVALVIWPPADSLAAANAYVFGPWSRVTPTDWLFLVALGLFAVVIGMLLARAYQVAPPATVATFEYSYLVFAAAWDILVFGTAPTPMSLIGMTMIVGAGLMVIRGRQPGPA